MPHVEMSLFQLGWQPSMKLNKLTAYDLFEGQFEFDIEHQAVLARSDAEHKPIWLYMDGATCVPLLTEEQKNATKPSMPAALERLKLPADPFPVPEGYKGHWPPPVRCMTRDRTVS